MSKLITKQIVIIIIAAVLIANRPVGAETLYVFYPSSITATAMQKQLEEACPEISVMAFGRFRDFRERVRKDAPDAVLTKQMVIDHIRGYTIRLSGSRGGYIREPYVFLSVNKPVDPKEPTNKPIAILDILGRKEMKAFVGRFLTPTPKLRRATKMEDMLQLLTFSAVRGILIPKDYVKHYRSVSEQNLVETPCPNMNVGIIALAVSQGKDAVLTVKSLTGLEKQIMALLEVEQWK